MKKVDRILHFAHYDAYGKKLEEVVKELGITEEQAQMILDYYNACFKSAETLRQAQQRGEPFVIIPVTKRKRVIPGTNS